MHNQQQRSEPGRHCVSHCKLQHWQQWHSVCLPDLQAEAADLRQELASGHSALQAARAEAQAAREQAERDRHLEAVLQERTRAVVR